MKIHFVAIGGTGMGAAAGLMAELGHEVRGSDGPLYPPMSTVLASLRIPVFEGFTAENLAWGPELVVVGNTCRADHVEVLAARARGLRCVSFPELLGEHLLAKRHSVVVAGTHGKTTTTALMAHLLDHAGRAPGFLIGGIPVARGRGFAAGRPPYFVLEGDEYDTASFDKRPKFVHYAARTAILTGVEYDHADIYPSMDALTGAFAMLVDGLPAAGQLLVCADSPAAVELAQRARCDVQRYRALGEGQTGSGPPAEWCGRARGLGQGRQQLTITRADGSVEICAEVALTGLHNMANCTATAAAASALGLSPAEIAAGLSSFAGVKRRQELRGRVRDVAVIDDFAHHPTAIATTLDGLRGIHGAGRLIAVFEPRSGTSRRSVFQEQFVAALAHADEAVVAPVFAAEKLAPAERLDRDRLVADLNARGTPAWGPPDVQAIVEHLAARCVAGDTVVIMSSGGFDGLPERLLAALGG